MQRESFLAIISYSVNQTKDSQPHMKSNQCFCILVASCVNANSSDRSKRVHYACIERLCTHARFQQVRYLDTYSHIIMYIFVVLLEAKHYNIIGA